MASDPKSPERIVAEARRIDEFFRDETVRSALDTLEKHYIEDMIAAKNGEERAHAAGKVKAVRAFVGELIRMIDAGVHEEAMQAMQLKFDEQKKKGLLA